jgi:hypothetical protein
MKSVLFRVADGGDFPGVTRLAWIKSGVQQAF